MSTALNNAIYARLAGTEGLSAYAEAAAAQVSLAGLLATDPDTSDPAIFYANKDKFDDQETPAYPRINFRPSGGTPDARFSKQTGHVGSPIYDFEIWENGESANTASGIYDLVEKLLDMSRGCAPALPLGSGVCKWMEPLTEMQLLFDGKYNAWAGLVRVRFVEVRY